MPRYSGDWAGMHGIEIQDDETKERVVESDCDILGIWDKISIDLCTSFPAVCIFE